MTFGDGRSLDGIRKVARDGGADIATRRAAMKALIEARPGDLREIAEVFARHPRPGRRGGRRNADFRRPESSAIGSKDVEGTLNDVWGELRDSPEEKRREIAALKARLTPEVLARASPLRKSNRGSTRMNADHEGLTVAVGNPSADRILFHNPLEIRAFRVICGLKSSSSEGLLRSPIPLHPRPSAFIRG